jgi:hypothetical protein
MTALDMTNKKTLDRLVERSTDIVRTDIRIMTVNKAALH